MMSHWSRSLALTAVAAVAMLSACGGTGNSATATPSSLSAAFAKRTDVFGSIVPADAKPPPLTGALQRGALSQSAASAPARPAVALVRQRDVAATPTVAIAADPATVTVGQSSTINWSSTNASTCTTSGNGWTGGVALPQAGSAITDGASFPTTLMYGLTCAGATASASATTTLQVVSASSSPPFISMSASPSTISVGSASTITWSAINGATCVTSGNGWADGVTVPVSGNVPTGTTTYAGTLVYGLSCTGPGGTSTAAATLQVNAASGATPTAALTVNPSSLVVGQSALITWSSTGATGCTSTGTGWPSGVALPASGSASTGAEPSLGTFTFGLTCAGSNGSASASANLQVVAALGPAPVVTLGAGPSAITVGQSATVAWSATNATACVTTGSGWPDGVSLPVSGSVQTSAAQRTGTLTYGLTCAGPGGSGSASAQLVVGAACTGPSTCIVVTPSRIQLVAQQGQAAPAQLVAAAFTGAGVVAGFAPGVTQPTWFGISSDTSTTSTGVAQFEAYAPAAGTGQLAPGTYSTSVRFASGNLDSNGNPINVVYQDVPVTLTVLPQFTASPAVLNFQVVGGAGLPVTQVVSVYKSDQKWTVASNASWLIAVAAPGTSSVAVNLSTTNLVPGYYQASLIFTDGDAIDAPQMVTVSLTVLSPDVATDTSGFSFVAAEGGGPPRPQTVNVSSSDGAPGAFTVRVAYLNSGVTDWLQLSSQTTTPAALSIQPDTTGLAPGTYQANVVLSPVGQPASENRVIAITYTVLLPVLSSSPALEPGVVPDITATTSGPITRTVAVTDNGIPIAWTVIGATVPYLSASPASGNTGAGTPLSITIDSAKIAGAPAGPYGGIVALQYVAAGQTQVLSIPVTVNVSEPLVHSVAPAVNEQNGVLSIVVSGSGFSTIDRYIVTFNGTPASHQQVLSDKLMRVTPPSLPPGAYAVSIANALGVATASAAYVVVQTPAFTAAAIPLTQPAKQLVYDPLRSCVYTIGLGTGTQTITKFSFANGQWTQTAYAQLADISGATMSINDNFLWVTADNTLYYLLLDGSGNAPVVYASDAFNASAVMQNPRSLADGTVFATHTGLADNGLLLVKTFATGVPGVQELLPGSKALFVDVPYTAGSFDGTRIFIADSRNGSGDGASLYDLVSNSLSAAVASFTTFYELNTNRDGSLVGAYNAVYDATLHAVAPLLNGTGSPSDINGVPVFSPDNLRTYLPVNKYLANPGSTYAPTLIAFDVSAPAVQSAFPTLWTRAITPGPTTTWPSPPGSGVVTPDGKTLFLLQPTSASTGNLLVVPVGN